MNIDSHIRKVFIWFYMVYYKGAARFILIVNTHSYAYFGFHAQSSSDSRSLAHPLSYVSRISPNPFTIVSRSSIEIIRLATVSRDLIRSPVRDDVVRAARTRTPSLLAMGNKVLGKVSKIGKRRGVWKLQVVN